ncbi:FAD-dependent oxidoreductase [Leifsonia sp. A12D58]|uniref:FAD-dependent oxidoreductase n=1 Tax=Leifsonia sp. A12D58 TaxID=3397674 RepID=UPI0039E038AF
MADPEDSTMPPMDESLWRHGRRRFDSDQLPVGERMGVVVVGAGLTGLVTAYLLARSGHHVIVLDAYDPGSLTTGGSTGKVSLLQGATLSAIAEHLPDEVVNAYVTANQAGQRWLLDFMGSHDVPFEERPAYSYADSSAGMVRLEREYDLGRSAGLPLERSRDTELPWKVGLALRLNNQLHINTMLLIDVLVAEVRALGVRVVGSCTATAVTATHDGYRVQTTQGEIDAGRVIAATGIPFLSRGGHFARIEAKRSSVAAYSGAGEWLRGMYLSVDEPRRSLLSTDLTHTNFVSGDVASDNRMLLVGGAAGVVGRPRTFTESPADVDEWTSARFPGATLFRRWWAQDYTTLDNAPYVGPLHPGEHGILVATGYAKWGLANAAAAGIALTALVNGQGLAWAHTLYRRRGWPAPNIAQMIDTNAHVAVETARGAARLVAIEHDPAGKDDAGVALDGLKPVAQCTVNGVTHRVSAICPHLGGVVTWNSAEASWDCPLHGSRFAPDGTRIEGPARSGLAAVHVGKHSDATPAPNPDE